MITVDSPATDVRPASAEAAVPADVVLSLDWRERVWTWLEIVGKRVGLPSLVIGLVSLCLSSASLYFVVKNYRMTVAGDRPELASNGVHVELASRPPHLVVDLTNVGKRIARRGTATLFSLATADGVPTEIGSTAIIGAGTNVFPGYGSRATFDSQSIVAFGFFMVCASYTEDGGSQYDQAFLFMRSSKTARDPAELAYEELASPDIGRCEGRQ